MSDDAARANWGGSWRMPTDAEWTELRDNCTWEWTTQNGVNGRKVTSKKNGNSIFLPAAAFRYDTSIGFVGSYGRYWSSSLNTDRPFRAWSVNFNSGLVLGGDEDRYYGHSVRPVYGDFVAVTSISLNRSSASLNVGQTVQLSASLSPSNATEKTVRWVTSNSGIAAVSDNGWVTAKSAGSATITAYASSGKSASCTVTVSSTNLNGHTAVDLGLSVKWATCNVGASSPEGYGNYYAWGETSTKSDYSWSTYRWCNGSYNTLTKYNVSSSYGAVDNKTVLEMSDDAARANWGGSWRMPTDAEWTELRTNCTWTWTTQGGKNGYKVTSKTNGNSIFLPAAGSRGDARLYDAGSHGYYWSSSLETDNPDRAWRVDFGSGYVGMYLSYRCNGRSVRPVTE
jgi:hypothetical protein